MRVPLGVAALGRAIDAGGAPLDGGPALRGRRVESGLARIEPRRRTAVREPLWTGVRAIDALLTPARGARLGIFGAPGAGKSSLLHAVVRGAAADAVVVGAVGERGREARAWIEACGPRTTVVCATADRSPGERAGAAELAFAQAHALRERGLHVLLVVDSLARYANALRELAVGTGEPCGRGGFPPSVFARLARTLEVAGATHAGTITLIATVLDDGDARDPVSDAARSLLDGHLALSPELARAGHYPAIDVPASASRTMNDAVTPAHARDATAVRSALAWLDRTREARELGIAPPAERERCVAAEAELLAWLRQGSELERPAATLAALAKIADSL